MATQKIMDDALIFYERYISPALFTEIERGPIWPVIASAIVLILIALEINGSVKTTNNEKLNTVTERIDQTLEQLYQKNNVVGWRISLLVSIVLALIVLFIFFPALPDGFDFFLITMVLFIIIYLGFNWFHWHWHKPTHAKHHTELLGLRHQIKDMEITQDINQFKSSDKSDYSSVLHRIESILHQP